MYDDAKRRIEEQDPDASKLAMNVLMWITCAKRRISIRELQEALAVEEGQNFLDQENVTDCKLLISVCAGLVAVDEESQVIRLVHHTTQDYLERKHSAWFPEAELRLTTVCVTYLSFDIFGKEFCTTLGDYHERLGKNPLYEYAVRNWGHHAHEAEADIRDLIQSFLMNKAKISASAPALGFLTHYFPSYHLNGTDLVTGLHLAAYFGLSEVVSGLLDEQVVLDPRDCFDRTPLFWAAGNGHESVVKLLLEHGADFDPKDEQGLTPIARAAHNGHESVVKLLLKKGANFHIRDEHGLTPLVWAGCNGHASVFKLLLKKSAGFDIRDDHGLLALVWAAYNGHESVLKLLPEKGADFNLKDEQGTWAVHKGHESVKKLLLAKSAGFNLKDEQGTTTLARAAQNGHESVIKFVLEHGTAFQ